MSAIFNTDEIFDMAEEIERNAARLYRQAAKNVADKEIRKMFLNMAVMEDEHLHIFEQMRGELAGSGEKQSVFDPDDEAVVYLQVMAGSHGTEGRISQVKNLTGDETVEEIINIAIDAEKNSIVFYTGLKDLMPSKVGKDNVEAVIREEMKHLASLNQQLATLKKK